MTDFEENVLPQKEFFMFLDQIFSDYSLLSTLYLLSENLPLNIRKHSFDYLKRLQNF